MEREYFLIVAGEIIGIQSNRDSVISSCGETMAYRKTPLLPIARLTGKACVATVDLHHVL
jgi:hypothetical protein